MDQRWRRNHDLPDTSRGANRSIDPGPGAWRLQREVDWLRHQLNSLRRDQIERARLATAKRDEQLHTLAKEHRRQLEEQQSQTRSLEKKLADVETVAQERDQLRLRVEMLGEELKHVARAAGEERKADADRQQSELRRLNQRLAERDDQVKQLREGLASNERLSAELRDELTIAREDHTRQTESMRAERERWLVERAELRDRVAILQTDHEAVELVCADLDHYADRLRYDAHGLSGSIDELVKHLAREQQQSRLAIHTLESQLESLTQRSHATERLNDRITLSLTNQQKVCDERNTLLMEKDHDISALNERLADLEQQLDAFQNACEASCRENDSLQERCQRQSERVASLEGEVDQLKQRVTESQCALVVRDERLRQLKISSSRERAEQADQAQQRFAEMTHELRQALNHEQACVETLTGERLHLQARQLACEMALASAKRTVEGLSSETELQRLENHALSRHLDEQSKINRDQSLRISELQGRHAQWNDDQVTLRASLNQQKSEVTRLEAELTDQGHQRDRLEHTIQELEVELQSSLRVIAETESTLDVHRDTFEQQLSQAKIQERERHDQIASALRLQVERLEAEVHRLAGDREGFHAEIARLARRLAESELDRAPISETRRLARELAQHRQAHAREREFLYARLDQLHDTRTQRAAA